MRKINSTFIVAIVSMGITIACFALLLKFLIPPILSKESLMVVLSMILMLNVEYIILLKSYELDLMYALHINKVREDSKTDLKKKEDLMKSVETVRGTRKEISIDDINAEIKTYRSDTITSISPGDDDERFVINFGNDVKEEPKEEFMPEFLPEETVVVEEPELIEEPDTPPQITMKDLIEEAEKQLLNEATSVTEPEVVAKPKVVAKKKAVVRGKKR